MRLMRYQYTISHVPGKSLITADVLSRKPIPRDETDRVLEKETKAYVNMIIEHIPATEGRLEEIKAAQAEDEICKELIRYCELGWPDKQSVPEVLKPYWVVKSELSVVEGLLLKGERIVIPSALRLEILNKILVIWE